MASSKNWLALVRTLPPGSAKPQDATLSEFRKSKLVVIYRWAPQYECDYSGYSQPQVETEVVGLIWVKPYLLHGPTGLHPLEGLGFSIFFKDLL